MLAARFGRMGADVGQPRLDLRDAVRVARRFRFLEEAARSLVGGKHDLDRGFVRARRFLRHLADTCVLRQRDRAGLRRKLAGDDAEQRGLAGAVTPDEAPPSRRSAAKGGVIDEETPGNAVRPKIVIMPGL